MDWIELVGFCGTGLTLGAWAMKSSLSLRIMGIASSVAFLGYGVLSQSWPVIATELMLLPLNAWRLRELIGMRRAARRVGDGFDWLLPHAARERIAAGAPILRAGEDGARLTLLLEGRVAGRREPNGLLGDALPFERMRELRTLVAEGEVVVARIDLAAIETLALETPDLCRRLTRLALDRMRTEIDLARVVPLRAPGQAGRMAA